MKFTDSQPIYLQIGAWICNKILQHEWPGDARIPSVRELGGMLQVNPNTVMRAYDTLQMQGIIYNRRGIGYFVSPDAEPMIHAERKTQFLEQELPQLFEKMSLLSVDIEELNRQFAQYHRHHENKQ